VLFRSSLSDTQDVANIHDYFRKQRIKWNGALEKWASEDKEIYESLRHIKGADKVIDELKKANLIHFSKERLRLPKALLFERKGKEVLSPHERLVKALSKAKDYEVILEKKKVSAKDPPVKVIPKDNTILVYEEHPDLLETIEVRDKKLKVKYGEWDFTTMPYSICKLSDKQDVVTFNTSHPLFKSKLSDEIIKRLSLGILLILKDRKDAEELLAQLNQLLERMLLG